MVGQQYQTIVYKDNNPLIIFHSNIEISKQLIYPTRLVRGVARKKPDCFFFYGGTASTSQMTVAWPVSYTHLDVYKRQILAWAQCYWLVPMRS